ncbi:MAG: nucleotidyltransferase domain-containing protein [Trueperaceae bacterium]
MNPDTNSKLTELLSDIVRDFSKPPEVQAILLGGSHTTGTADEGSDVDLYIYVSKEIPVETRATIITPRANYAELDNRFWETEDNWLEPDGRKVEIIYRGQWVAEHLENLLEKHQVQMGYSTSIWHSVLTSVILFERDVWFTNLQNRVRVPYSDELAKAIIAKNFPLLKGSLVAHPNEVYKAAVRNDIITIHHRIEDMLKSYFDVLFALNRELHPGEKRLLAYAEKLEHQPQNMSEDVREVLLERNPEKLKSAVENLVNRLEALLKARGAL